MRRRACVVAAGRPSCTLSFPYIRSGHAHVLDFSKMKPFNVDHDNDTLQESVNVEYHIDYYSAICLPDSNPS